ncbi:class I SAM-dependent methyltransferase [Paenibacillus cisolokensis]|nr:class I SAM-dependent methyltransferase [Paenibacillus cisolokensis]
MDLLSRLGVASSHPGGFKATQKLLDKALEQGDLRILEVGCGTGKTACYLAGQGFRVTALDRHPLMLEKAKKRAEKEGITDIEWIQGDVQELPFDNESFDVVYAESVTIFTDIPKSLEEYYRVLKPGGRLIDREIVLYSEIPEPSRQEIMDFFKFDKIPSVDEWLVDLRQAGFQCERPKLDEFRSHEHAIDPSEIQELDLTVLFDPEIGLGIMKYADLVLAQEPYFRVGDFIAWKTRGRVMRNHNIHKDEG